MNFISKKFDRLTVSELYEILKSRSEVFLLEQGIVCQDIDDVDRRALHCFLWENGRVIAYLRAFYDDADADTVKIGRVLTLCHGVGHGRLLMEKSLAEIKKKMPCHAMLLHSQTHAIGFYQKFGFKVVSEEFDEEGVPHVEMLLTESHTNIKGESSWSVLQNQTKF